MGGLDKNRGVPHFALTVVRKPREWLRPCAALSELQQFAQGGVEDQGRKGEESVLDGSMRANIV